MSRLRRILARILSAVANREIPLWFSHDCHGCEVTNKQLTKTPQCHQHHPYYSGCSEVREIRLILSNYQTEAENWIFKEGEGADESVCKMRGGGGGGDCNRAS